MNLTPRYVGRFAPSPTGPLHMGSLVTAMASYLEARTHSGLWLLRIEDIDLERCSEEASREIVAQLAACGFEHDGEISRQDDPSRRLRYESILSSLIAQDLVYPCTCTRSKLSGARRTASGEPVYPGYCANSRMSENSSADRAVRFRYISASRTNETAMVTFLERGKRINVDPHDDVGDFVVKRADKQFAYQLAVVVDDEDAGVSHVVRGADLFANSARQVALIRALGFRRPQYFHVPVVTNAAGEKLSKQTKAPPIAIDNALSALNEAWALLRQAPLPPAPSVSAFWQQAIPAWRSGQVQLL
jgi:glutamyl-Q tRNA(Asp) synthetase